VALNPVDSLYVAHPADKTPGRVVGSDVAGTIEKVGTEVTGWAVGDRVAGLLQGGTPGFLIYDRYPKFFRLKPPQETLDPGGLQSMLSLKKISQLESPKAFPFQKPQHFHCVP